MAIILNIDTAVNVASLCITRDGEVLAVMENAQQQDHARWMHEAISTLLRSQGLELKDLQAIAVSNGPGSYTGLRVGLSAAKGICYALNIPLITLSTLRIIAEAQKDADTDFISPFIDARRKEVFMAVYDRDGVEKQAPAALILEENSMGNWTAKGSVLICGNGSEKAISILNHHNITFSNKNATAVNMSALAETAYVNQDFADLAYAEPFYLKEFYHASGS